MSASFLDTAASALAELMLSESGSFQCFQFKSLSSATQLFTHVWSVERREQELIKWEGHLMSFWHGNMIHPISTYWILNWSNMGQSKDWGTKIFQLITMTARALDCISYSKGDICFIQDKGACLHILHWAAIWSGLRGAYLDCGRSEGSTGCEGISLNEAIF